MRNKKFRMFVLASLALALAMRIAVAGVSKLTNPGGATVEILTAEADSSAVKTNPLGASVELVTTDQISMDSPIFRSAWLYVGMIEPEPLGTNAARNWALYD